MINNKKIYEIIASLEEMKKGVLADREEDIDNIIFGLSRIRIELEEYDESDDLVFAVLGYKDKDGSYIPYIAEGIYVETYDASPDKNDTGIIHRVIIKSMFDNEGNLIQNVNLPMYIDDSTRLRLENSYFSGNSNTSFCTICMLFSNNWSAEDYLKNVLTTKYFIPMYDSSSNELTANLITDELKKSMELTKKINIYNRHKISNLDENYDQEVYCFIPYYNKKGQIDNYVVTSGTYIDSYYDPEQKKQVYEVSIPASWDQNGKIVYNCNCIVDKISSSQVKMGSNREKMISKLVPKKNGKIDYVKLEDLLFISYDLTYKLEDEKEKYYARKRKNTSKKD